MEAERLKDGGVAPIGFHKNDIQLEYQPITPDSGSEQPKLSDSDASLSSDENGSTFVDAPAHHRQHGMLAVDADDQADEVENVLGISISRVQSRMKARQTPAEEKSRAIENSGGYFADIPDSQDEQTPLSPAQYQSQLTEEPENIRRAPSPTTAGSRADESKRVLKNAGKTSSNRNSFTRSMLMSGLSQRRRALSGDSTYSLNLRKLLPDFSLSSTRLSSSSTKASSFDTSHSRSASSPQNTANEHSSNIGSKSTSMVPSSDEDGIAALGAIQNSHTHSYQRHPTTTKSRPPLSVRRSMSDESLYLRSLSRASTLEHRPHYENVHSMVNSRYKAIKDSLQDSSSRIFSMPTFNLPDFRHEWHPRLFLTEYQRKEGSLTNVSGDSSGTDANGDAKAKEMTTNTKMQPKHNTIFPILDTAASQLTGDVVVMGGYRGSVLRSAKPPHRQLWVPMKVGLGVRKVDLEVGLTPEDEERMEETVIAREVLSHIGPVDICRRLLHRLRKFEKSRNGEIRAWDYGYDWRLSPHLLSKRLIKFLEGLPCNAPDVPPEKRGAYVIAHSLGGLITRHAVNQRPDLFAGVMYAGTPQHCVNILGPLRHGDEVLLSSKVLTAQVNFTIRTSYALLPDDGRCFINKDTKEDYIVDFFDVKSWEEHALSPCITTPLPPAGNENKKGLRDNLPNSLSTLPKMSLGKKFSVKKLSGGGRSKESASSIASSGEPRATREKDQAEKAPGGSENEEMPVESKTAAATGGGTAGGIMGPNTAKTHKPSTGSLSSSSDMNVSNAAGGVCTIPRDKAIKYLDRTLKEVRQFRQELAFNESHQKENRYPPFAVMYSKALPTVYGARVQSRDDIKRSDAFDDLAFAAGDGVCLASAAMLPDGYRLIKHGLVRSDRGHVGLLGDLEGTGQCLLALIRGREMGVGLGAYATTSPSDENKSNSI